MPANTLDNPHLIPVLGLLAESPAHVYQIASTLSQERGIPVSRASIGRLMEAMQREGWVAPLRTEQSGNRPVRTVYHITGKGWAALARQVNQYIRNPEVHISHFIGALSYLGAVKPGTAIDALHQRIKRLKETSRQLEQDRISATQSQGITRLHLIEIEYVVHQIGSEIHWLDSLANEITSGSITWPTHAHPEKKEDS